MNKLSFPSTKEVKTGEVCPQTGLWTVKEIPILLPMRFQKNVTMPPMSGCVVTYQSTRRR